MKEYCSTCGWYVVMGDIHCALSISGTRTCKYKPRFKAEIKEKDKLKEKKGA